MKKIGIIAVYKEDAHGAFSRLYHDYISVIESHEWYVSYIIPCNTAHIEHFISEMDGFILPGWDDVDPCVYGHVNTACNKSFAENDKVLLWFIEKIVESKKPFLWICKWMQLMNIYFGGTLTQDIKKSALHDQWEKAREYIHEVSLNPQSVLYDIFQKDILEVNSIHHQAIDILWKWLKVIAQSPDNYIEAIEHIDHRQILGVQWHPELLTKHHILFQRFFGEKK